MLREKIIKMLAALETFIQPRKEGIGRVKNCLVRKERKKSTKILEEKGKGCE